MQLVIADHIIVATHTDDQNIKELYPSCKIYNSEYKFYPNDSLLTTNLDIVKKLQRDYLQKQLDEVRKNGYVCSNNITLQCEEEDLARWGQAKDIIDLAGLEEISIRDIDNVNHTISKTIFNNMMIEVGVYIQGLLNDIWIKKDLVNSCTTQEDILKVLL